MLRCLMILSLIALAVGKERSFEAVDTHTHILLYGPLRHDHWVKDNRPFLQRNYTVDDLERVSKSTPVRHYIIVGSSRDGNNEMDVLAKLSKNHDSIAGIVARLPLDDSLESKLDRIKPGNLVVGIRDTYHHVSAMFKDQSLWPALAMLEKKGKTLDVIASAADLKNLTFTAQKFPRLKIIINHLGRPYREPNVETVWMEGITEVSKNPNIYVKVSQFFNAYDFAVARSQTLSPNRSFSHYKEMKPKIKHLLESFGVDRCLFGSDWPNSLTAYDNYKEVYDMADKLLQNLTEKERRKIFAENAIKVYGLDLKTDNGSGASRAASSAITLISLVLICFYMRYG